MSLETATRETPSDVSPLRREGQQPGHVLDAYEGETWKLTRNVSTVCPALCRGCLDAPEELPG